MNVSLSMLYGSAAETNGPSRNDSWFGQRIKGPLAGSLSTPETLRRNSTEAISRRHFSPTRNTEPESIRGFKMCIVEIVGTKNAQHPVMSGSEYVVNLSCGDRVLFTGMDHPQSGQQGVIIRV